MLKLRRIHILDRGCFIKRQWVIPQDLEVLISMKKVFSFSTVRIWNSRNSYKYAAAFLRIPERAILNIYGTLFFDPPFLWSQMVKNYFFTIENPFTVFFWAQQYPKRPFENHWSSFSGKGQKWKNGPKSHFLVIDCLETWSACSLQLFCVLKAVKPRKRVW